MLHRDPLPTFDNVIAKLIFEKTCLGPIKFHSLDIVLTTSSSALTNSYASQSHSNKKVCKYYHKTGYILSKCLTIECCYCYQLGHIVENCPTRPPKSKEGQTKSHPIAIAVELITKPFSP